MREAQITCQCPEIRIPDLGIRLTQGQTIWLDSARVKSSRDLDHARRIQAVRIEWKERAKSTKILTSSKKITVTFPNEVEPLLPSPPPGNPLLDDIRQVVSEEVAKAISALEERLVKCISQQNQTDTKSRKRKEA